jgi:outer membrane protein assembly factor BamB
MTHPSLSFLRRSVQNLLLLGVGCGMLSGLGCSGRNIHPELSDTTGIVLRKWTLQTRQSFDAGDRGYEYSNPVLAENTLVFGNQTSGLVSLYPRMLAVRWALPIPGGVTSEVTVEKGSAYAVGGDGFLYSVLLETGQVQWRYDLKNPGASRPTFHQGRLFVTTTDDAIHCFDAGTGKWLWHYRRRSNPPSSILGASRPVVDQGEVIVGMSDGYLVGLGLEEGQLKWERRLHPGGKFTDVDAEASIDQGVMYVPSYDGALYALKRKGAEILWRQDIGGSKRVRVDGERLILPSSEGQIVALQKSNGKILWKFELDKGVPTQVEFLDRYLVVGSSFQYLYLIDRETGKGVYRFNVGDGSGFTGAPAVDPETQRFYILSGAGNLYAFELQKPHGSAKSAPR